MMKKSIAMSIGLSATALAFATMDIHAAEKGIVTTDTLNVRSGAGTNYSVIDKIHRGDEVEILSTSNGWYKIKLSNGKVGWSSDDYISTSSNGSGGGTSNESTGKYGTVTTDTLNVRSGAGTSYSVIDKVHRGDKVEILSSSNGWYKIKLSNGKVGWSSDDYISTSSNGSGGGTSNESTGKYGTVTTDTLNVRSGAGTSYSVIDKVHRGDKVEILSSSNGWYKIKLSNGKVGWSSDDYISTSSNGSGGGTSNESTGKYGTVTTDTLNVRSGAGTSYSVIDKVHRGDKVEILSSSNGWYKIKLSNGKVGWSSDDYISTGNSSGSGTVTTPSTNKQQAIVDLAKKQLGKPYVWGAEGPSSFDCSGLTYYVYKNAAGVSLPRTSKEQSKTGTTINRSNLQPGDLLFSSTDGSGNVSHVGIYIGNGEMIHAPKPGDVVRQTNINNSYWNKAYLWAKRVL